jgi:O-antigen/teichoic acid export membrane protein
MAWTKTKVDLVLATAAEVLQKLSGYAVLGILARRFDKTSMGQLFFVLALASMLAAGTELGTTRYLVREVATTPSLALRRLGEVLSLRVPLALVALAVVGTVVSVTRPDLAPLALPALIAGLLTDLSYTFGGFLVGRREVGLRLVTGLSGPAVLLSLVAIAAARGATPGQVMLCYAAASVVPVAAGAFAVRRRFGPIPLRGTPAGAITAARASLPFFLLTTLGVVHFKVDTLLLFALATPAAVATYEAAYKLFEVSRFVIRPTATVFFPVSAALAGERKWIGFGHTLRRLLALSGGAGVAVSIVILASAGFVISLAWGHQYDEAVPVLRVLYLAVPTIYLGFVATFLAGALHLEAAAARVLGLCLLANVGLNLLAIPRWGPLGAAWTTVITETFATLWLLRLIRRAVQGKVAAAGEDPVTASATELFADG